MARKVQTTALLLLVVAACTSMLPNPGLAQLPLLTLPPLPQLQGVPPGIQDDIGRCWSAVSTVPGCIVEFQTSIISGSFNGTVGPACCRALVTIYSNCWPRSVPRSPVVDAVLNTICPQSQSPAPAPAAL